jgi:two-component system, OmpR family, sensor histidine kinase KdpD
MSPGLVYATLYITAHVLWAGVFRSRVDPWVRRRIQERLGIEVVWVEALRFPMRTWTWGLSSPGDEELDARLALVSTVACFLGACLPMVVFVGTLSQWSVFLSLHLRQALYLASVPLLVFFMASQMRRPDVGRKAGAFRSDEPTSPSSGKLPGMADWADGRDRTLPRRPRPVSLARSASAYLAGLLIVTASTLVAWFVFGQSELADVVMVLLLGVVVVSMRFGYGASLLAASLSVIAFEFCFLPPYFSLAIANLRHVVTFAVMFAVAFVISHLTKRVHDQADAARDNERRTGSLYAVSRELGLAHSPEELLQSAARHLREVFGARVAFLLPKADETLDPVLADVGTTGARDCGEREAAQWAWLQQRSAGAGLEPFASVRARFVPLNGSRGRVGVLAVFPSETELLHDPEEQQLLETFAGLVGSALERTKLAEEARRASLRAETEQLRSALLSSVSHDLRTPLAVVTGATSALLDERAPEDEASRRVLLETAHKEALRLNQLVRNLLEMARLEAGALKVRSELQPLEEVIGAALHRLEGRLRDREVEASIPPNLPLVPFDPVLIEQVLINLIENATKYTPSGSPIDVSAVLRDGAVETEIADRGPGVAKENEERVFEKFYRAREGEGGGVGLGLTICRGIISAHGGRIWVSERPGGGASFRFTLPLGHEGQKIGVQ